MRFSVYQTMAARTINDAPRDERQLTNLCMGLAGETGEFVDLIKKHVFQGHSLDRAKALEELGDILCYLSGLATHLGADLERDIAKPNLVKTATRYPNGFNPADSQARVDTRREGL